MNYWLSVNGLHPVRGTLCWVTDRYECWLARRAYTDIPEQSVWIPLESRTWFTAKTVTHYLEVEIPVLPSPEGLSTFLKPGDTLQLCPPQIEKVAGPEIGCVHVPC